MVLVWSHYISPFHARFHNVFFIELTSHLDRFLDITAHNLSEKQKVMSLLFNKTITLFLTSTNKVTFSYSSSVTTLPLWNMVSLMNSISALTIGISMFFSTLPNSYYKIITLMHD